MSDAPIYERLASGNTLNPFVTRRQPLRAGNTQVTVPLEPGPTNALNELHQSLYEEACAVLAPYGLHPYDIAQPRYERIVYEDGQNNPDPHSGHQAVDACTYDGHCSTFCVDCGVDL